ncbi:alpha/beta hydrolase [Streptomyces sirii]|uniref:alpha/beta hydrolase n=1 Tax=Streptomyces sirii TaxID=3127701 RepID=UPI003D364C17
MIRARLERDTGKEPEPLLLGIGPEGQGRAILSYGDPDTADNVAAYVPGLNTQLKDVGHEDGDRAKNVWDSAQYADRRQKTASIVWLGYDAPQGGRTGSLRLTFRLRTGSGARRVGQPSGSSSMASRPPIKVNGHM